MKLADLVKKNVERLPMREQARVFSESFRSSVKAQEERVAAAKETFGALSDDAQGRSLYDMDQLRVCSGGTNGVHPGDT